MKVPNAVIENAASKDAHNGHSMEHVLLRNGRLVATDGHILASVPVETCESDKDGLVPAEALSRARSAAKTMATAKWIDAGQRRGAVYVNAPASGSVSVICPLFQFKVQRPVGQFPNYETALPKAPQGTPPTVILDLGQLQTLARAIGAEQNGKLALRLWVTDASKAVWVEPFERSGAFGVIMPLFDEAQATPTPEPAPKPQPVEAPAAVRGKRPGRKVSR